VLLIGVTLLVFTFISAYGLLTQSLSIIASADLVQTFGEALGPLIATCIRIMYLGVMGWVGSLLTIRGVTLIANAPKMEAAVPSRPVAPTQPQQQPQQKPASAPQKAKVEPEKEKEPKPEAKPEVKPEAQPEPKPEAKPPEPQIIMIPPEQITQPPPQQKEPEKTESPPPPQ
jgi:hypothetical protein